MLLDPRYFRYWSIACLLLTGFISICGVYVYRANKRRPNDDPNKQDFPFMAALLTPITWPALIVGLVAIFLMRAILMGVSLLLAIVGLLVIRKPFLLVWFDKVATKVGTMLLVANTSLIRAFLRKTAHDLKT